MIRSRTRLRAGQNLRNYLHYHAYAEYDSVSEKSKATSDSCPSRTRIYFFLVFLLLMLYACMGYDGVLGSSLSVISIGKGIVLGSTKTPPSMIRPSSELSGSDSKLEVAGTHLWENDTIHLPFDFEEELLPDLDISRPKSNMSAPPGVIRKGWMLPLVDRTVLRKLERVERFYDQDFAIRRSSFRSDTSEKPYNDNSNRALTPPNSTRPWLEPLVTFIPERPFKPGSNKLNPKYQICESAKHPRPCRFLLPIRIAEQESKARIHLGQIAQLARSLNRILVLPNVGKSKLGACYKWNFGTYYDVASSSLLNEAGIDSTVELDLFKKWMDQTEDRRLKRGLESISSQLVSFVTSLPSDTVRKDAIYGNKDVAVHTYSKFGNWEPDLPSCFSSKFNPLELETLPIVMTVNASANNEGYVEHVGDSILDAFDAWSARTKSREDIFGPFEPQVLAVNWDLRHQVFPMSSLREGQRSLVYSKQMHDLADLHSPKGPYLAVHWRMETVNPERLHDCAHALVDVLSRMLHDETLSANISTIWFASDYPYPIARRTKANSRPVVPAKSGTFVDFHVLHEEAMEILRDAFHDELRGWSLTDLAERLELNNVGDTDVDEELMRDPGISGIRDKLVSVNANLFVSGSTRCSRKSSFTKQVVDARSSEWSRRRNGSQLRNVVDIFG